jgi:hypothetical protein
MLQPVGIIDLNGLRAKSCCHSPNGSAYYCVRGTEKLSVSCAEGAMKFAGEVPGLTARGCSVDGGHGGLATRFGLGSVVRNPHELN